MEPDADGPPDGLVLPPSSLGAGPPELEPPELGPPEELEGGRDPPDIGSAEDGGELELSGVPPVTAPFPPVPVPAADAGEELVPPLAFPSTGEPGSAVPVAQADADASPAKLSPIVHARSAPER
jgi:hypothetical protein